ncbi:MAG: hypothetical protein JRJ66_02085 [Deltaproteobacteria bacterium]|nr:hypothetical protein [Deltaproteobacteria bacterium]
MVFLVPPNWSQQVSVTRSWRTTLFRSKTGREMRTALRTFPVRGMRFLVDSLSQAETAYIKRVLKFGLAKLLGVPYWVDSAELSSQANSGQAVLNVDSTQYKEFESGRMVVILDPDDIESYELGEVSSFDDTSITLTANLANTWPAGSMVYPLLPARVEGDPEITSRTSGYGTFSFSVQESFEATTTSSSSSTTTTTA